MGRNEKMALAGHAMCVEIFVFFLIKYARFLWLDGIQG